MALILILNPWTRASSSGNAIDILTFGNAESEKTHQLSKDHAEDISGGLDEPSVRLLPLDPPSHNGGSISFTMKVDPRGQNYVTVRLWGSDKGSDSGQLVLYADGKQVGYRMQGDYDLINICEEDAFAPGRFFYETRPLPPWMTEGKETISLKIAALGPQWSYGQTFEKYQKKLKRPSRGIYSVYTHTDPRIEPPSSEKRGVAPVASLRATHGPDVVENSKQMVLMRLRELLGKNSSKGWKNLTLLAEAYHLPWTPAYQNPAVIQRVLQEGDNLAAAFTSGKDVSSDKEVGREWPGAGPLGEAIVKLWPEISKHLDDPFPGRENVTRREVWTKALRKSVDFWRQNRRYYTNQAMILDAGIYAANRGLRLVAPDQALPEEKALRYVREAVGLDPWMDRDIVDGNEERSGDPFHGKYFLVTRKNLSRELGWVGAYGETILHWTRELAAITENADILRQLGKLQAARLIFRYPSVDADGYFTMKTPCEVCNRTAHFPYPGPAYSAASVRESWGMDVAAMLPDDPTAVGVAQRSMTDGQYYHRILSRLADADVLGMMRNVEEFEKVRQLKPVPYRFPMEDGQPDFVFSDEENAMVALKHGDRRIFANLYFRAESAVNNVAKIMELNPSTVRLVTAKTKTVADESGEFVTRPNYINYIRTDKLRPPGEKIDQAWAGEKMPIAKLPGGNRSSIPGQLNSWKPGDYGAYVGRASFYMLTYGDYLFGLNTTENQTYDLPVPAKVRTYTDLVSQKEVPTSEGVVKVPPLSTVVLYLGNPEGNSP